MRLVTPVERTKIMGCVQFMRIVELLWNAFPGGFFDLALGNTKDSVMPLPNRGLHIRRCLGSRLKAARIECTVSHAVAQQRV